MKLLRKTNRTYLLISASAFIVAGVIIYFVLSMLIEHQLRERLESDMHSIIQTIVKDNTIPKYYPFIEIRKVSSKTERSVSVKDTTIYDNAEHESVPYRQVSSVKYINGEMYLIIVRDTLLEKSDMLMIIVIVIGLVFLLLNLSLYFINRKLSINIWKPFYDTLDRLKGFSPDGPQLKLQIENEIDEFTELNRTLENLTMKVVSDYQSLKRFTEDASHEMQTPLAVLQSKLETLLQLPDIKKDQAELIKSAYTSVQRISKLIQTLLLLTKIANDQFPEKSRVNISDLLEEKIKLFSDHIENKSLIVEKSIENGLTLEANFFLTESLLMNLIGNAVKHSDKEGKINIALKEGYLKISNEGQALAVPPEKLFERFYKVDKSTISQGLGLAIVKEICRLNRWEIEYEYQNSQHNFIIRF
jgi:two-component system, OmpR family, sensor kinase